MIPTVFIQCNSFTLPVAKVAEYSMRKYAKDPSLLDVRLINLDECDAILKHHEGSFMRNGQEAWWYKDVPQAFLPVRFRAAKMMGFEGRALVMDPDIFALRDVTPLLTRDMGGKAILARPDDAAKGHHSSVMLLECSKLAHWDWDSQIDRLFNKEFDFEDWLKLRLEEPGTIGPLEEKFNSFDKVEKDTVLLHTTNPRTQPWKTGLVWKESHMNNARKSDVDEQSNKKYLPNFDINAEYTFLSLLAECLDSGIVTEQEINDGITKGELRPDLIPASRNAKKLLIRRRLREFRSKISKRASGLLSRAGQ